MSSAYLVYHSWEVIMYGVFCDHSQVGHLGGGYLFIKNPLL